MSPITSETTCFYYTMVSRKRLHQKKPDPPTVPELMMKGFIGLLVLAGIVAVVFVVIKLLEEEDAAATPTPAPGTPTPAPGPPGPTPPPQGPATVQEENNDTAIGLGVGAAVLVAAIIATIVMIRSRKRQGVAARAQSSPTEGGLDKPLVPKHYEPPLTENKAGGYFKRKRYGNDDTTSLNSAGQTRSEFAAE